MPFEGFRFKNTSFLLSGKMKTGCFWGNSPEKRKKSNDNKNRLTFSLYPDPGSNRDGLPHWCLRPARLPIPPSGRISLDFECKGRRFFYICKTLAGFFSYSGIIL